MYSSICVMRFGDEPDKYGDNKLTSDFTAWKYMRPLLQKPGGHSVASQEGSRMSMHLISKAKTHGGSEKVWH